MVGESVDASRGAESQISTSSITCRSSRRVDETVQWPDRRIREFLRVRLSARTRIGHVSIGTFFPRAYYETKAPGSGLSKKLNTCLFLTANDSPLTEHLTHWNSNRNSLNGFTDRIAGLKKDLIGLLSQQVTQHPWKHADALAQIESRSAPNRVFYNSIFDANEEVARAMLSKNGGEAAVHVVSWHVP